MMNIEQRLKEISKIAYGEFIPISHRHYEDYIAYEDEETLHRFVSEGIKQRDDGEYEFNWDEDEEDDIIYLNVEAYHCDRKQNPIHYYGYSFNWRNPETRRAKNKLISFLKHNIYKEDVTRMLDNTVDRLIDHLDMERYDYIVVVPSSSQINEYMSSSIINYYSNIRVIPLEKINAENIKIDWDAIRSGAKSEDEFKKIKNDVASYIRNNQGKPAIIKILPKWCRQYVKPIIKIGRGINNDEISKARHILIVDDILTSGKTIGDAMRLLNEAGYKGDYTAFTFINNH